VQVADVMTRDVEFVEASTTIAEAAVAMGDLGVGALPVGTADDLQGIITDRDILFRVVAKGLGNKTVTVGEVMTTTIFSCRQEDSITTALNLMGARNLRRLPVLDLNGRTIGLVTLSDLSRRMLLDSGVVQRAVAELSGTPSA
jgi:CBS domain-containing protein